MASNNGRFDPTNHFKFKLQTVGIVCIQASQHLISWCYSSSAIAYFKLSPLRCSPGHSLWAFRRKYLLNNESGK